jgi:hypothetical protein
VANFKDESGLNPGINEANPIVPGSRGGFGLYQLTGPRRKAYEAYAAEKGVDPANTDAQLDFLMTELQGPEKAAAQKILSAPDTGTAAQAIVSNFLRPAPEHRERRSAAYAALSGGPVEVAQAAPQRQGIMSALMGGPQPTASDMPSDYFPPAPSQGGGIDMMQAQELLGNEFLPQGRRAALEALVASEQQRQQMAQEQQMKQSDPAYQLGLQKTQLELERLRNPDADFITGRDGAILRADKRKGTVEQVYGGKPDKPTDVQEYEYAKEQGFPGTFTDFQQQMKRAGASQVNIDQKAEGAFDKKLAEKQAESLDAMATEGMNAKADLAVIGELSTLMQGRGGTLDGFSGALAKYGIGGEGVGDIQAAQALINRLVPTQRQPGSGSMSDRDVEMFTRSLPSLWNQPGGNERILATMQGLAQYKQAQGDIAQRVMTGEISRQDATKALRELPNPLEAFRSAKPATQPEPAAQPAPAAPQAAPAGEPSIDDLLKMYGK